MNKELRERLRKLKYKTLADTSLYVFESRRRIEAVADFIEAEIEKAREEGRREGRRSMANRALKDILQFMINTGYFIAKESGDRTFHVPYGKWGEELLEYLTSEEKEE